MKIIAIANHKGGVGKSTTAHTLGDALAMLGYSVLLVDCDAQSTLTNATGVHDAEPNLADVFNGRCTIADILHNVAHHENGRLHLAAGDITLALVEKNLPAQLDGYHVLKEKLPSVAAHYDVCLIDCPPSLSALVYNALIAADAVIIPTLPQINDLRGLNLFLDTVVEIQSKPHLNPKLSVLGVLVTMFDSRLITHQQALEILQKNYTVFDTMIGRSIRIAESPAIGQSILTYEPGNPQAANYRQLANEVGTWLNG